MKRVVVAGGGAAGFFFAINCAEKIPGAEIIILEQSSKFLQKVRISGGGRCNVTHACFDARDLSRFYPRGEKALIGPFTRFNPTHTIRWFHERGVPLKTEEDGRMFPEADTSSAVIECFMQACRQQGIQLCTNEGVEDLTRENGVWKVTTEKGRQLTADAVVITTGSALRMWKLLEQKGHTIVAPVPSLFTFNIRDEKINGLQGLAVPDAVVKILGTPTLSLPAYATQSGPVLITHWGLSGPAILRLSAWCAIELAGLQYHFDIAVNWCGKKRYEEVLQELKTYRQQHPKKGIAGQPLFGLPRRLWERLTTISLAGKENLLYADSTNKQLEELAKQLTASTFAVNGKSTYKDEFVTAGGVDLNEVDFKTMQSKLHPGLYFAGEVLNIDAITGGFNFQEAWTTAFIAADSIAASSA